MLEIPVKKLAEIRQPWSGLDLADAHSIAAARVVAMYEAAFTRPPQPAELVAAVEFVLAPSAVDSGQATAPDTPARWADLAHALINTKEFIFLR